jgi:hypothetical protein
MLAWLGLSVLAGFGLTLGVVLAWLVVFAILWTLP